MAIKGLAYSKTTWAFQERPVSSSKLNTWDDRIEAALELLHFLVAHAWGGGDGVIRHATEHDLAVVATAPPSLRATVQPGYAFISRFAYKLAEPTDIPEVTPPASQPRRDLVVARLATWDVAVIEGTEAPSPETPDPDPDTIPLAVLHLRPGMTSLKDTDDSINGYILDQRTFV